MAYRINRSKNSELGAYELVEIGLKKPLDEPVGFIEIKPEVTRAMKEAQEKVGDLGKLPSQKLSVDEAENDDAHNQLQQFMEIEAQAKKTLEEAQKKVGVISKLHAKKLFEGEAKNDYDCLFKFVMIGESNSGQFSLLQRLVNDEFKENYPPQEGEKLWCGEFYSLKIDDKKIKLQIFDRTIQKEHDNPAIYRGAKGIILLFDLTNKKKFFDNKEKMEDLIYRSFPEGMDSNIILVGTKADLIAERQVSKEDMQAYAKKLGVSYIETSAKLNLNVEVAFSALTYAACDRLAQLQAMLEKQQSVSSVYKVERSKALASTATPWQKVLATLGLRPKTSEAQGSSHK